MSIKNCKTAEEAEAEYRARREEAKVWRRENEEADRQVQEIRARQKQVYCDDMASRVSRTMDNEEVDCTEPSTSVSIP